MKEWLKITVEVPRIMKDAVSGFLFELTKNGVEISSLPEGSTPETERIIGYCYKEKDGSHREKLLQLQKFLTQIKLYFPVEGEPVFYTDYILEEDWGRTWKKFFKTIRITPRIVIKPSWESYDSIKNKAREDEIVIEMDPGLSFGTGHHDSTRLILTIIDQLFSEKKRPKTVLDVGTGTGILAMSSALLGASNVLAIDNDTNSLVAAKKNVTQNSLENIITVSGQDVTTIKEQFDLITVNIVFEVLREMSSNLTDLLGKKGRLILSGILKGDQERSIIKIYEKLGLSYTQTKSSNEWVALVFNNI